MRPTIAARALIPFGLLVGVIAGLAFGQAPDAAGKLKTRVFPVSDLATPTLAGGGPSLEQQHDQLLNLIRIGVAPKSWAQPGAAMRFSADGSALVVHQSAEVHEQVARLLAGLRKQNEITITAQVRAAVVSDAWYQEHIARDGRLNRKSGVLLDAAAARQLIDRMNGPGVRTIHDEKLSTLSGQEVKSRAIQGKTFVTGMKRIQTEQQTLYVPECESFDHGFAMSLRANAMEDRNNIVVKLQAELVEPTCAQAPLVPVETSITPVFESGEVGKQIPYTQYVQEPSTIKRGVNQSIRVPTGQMLFVYGGDWEYDGTQVEHLPILSDLPGVGIFFDSKTGGAERRHLILLLSPTYGE